MDRSPPASSRAIPPSWARLSAHLRPHRAAAAYPPNRAFLGALSPDALAAFPRPWFETVRPADPCGPHGFIAAEEEFYGFLKADDEVDAVWLDEVFAAEARAALVHHPLTAPGDLELPVFHITEERVKALVPPDVYTAQVGLAEMALDTGAIAEVLRQVRARVGD